MLGEGTGGVGRRDRGCWVDHQGDPPDRARGVAQKDASFRVDHQGDPLDTLWGVVAQDLMCVPTGQGVASQSWRRSGYLLLI